ncbi:NifZ family protein [Denitrovibrio acetiphilus DSM 12809]|jgi:nitrogen fixation protein NifZ|uniref:NifZ family protein n=1 Tax=Denitrovibrio acetiphilus (strain DSM 12809 / NBRC 114555 / N2460) TaxID=522772 RepID=D4H6V1_DENA2|nr:nitrogen fixation protein NifZ [Denitrovibrio acetiphilus]ADD67817.1 NifZ family protein [Denitrovibrio acetiphilus DSM 12809]
MKLKINQLVKVNKIIRDDGTCAGCSRGEEIAYVGLEGFICDIQDFLFEPVYVVHFMDSNRRIGFREAELDVVEDFDEETETWVKIETVAK